MKKYVENMKEYEEIDQYIGYRTPSPHLGSDIAEFRAFSQYK